MAPGIIWDPLRKREVTLTPEEKVRQWCIGVLSQRFQVPMHMMMSEVGIRLGGKQMRCDIMVYDRQARPLLVVECKRPEVELTGEVLDQAIRYNMVLNVKYMVITNGTRTCAFVRTSEGNDIRFVPLKDVPVYNDMICQQQ